MPAPVSTHPDPATLSDYGLGRLPPGRRAEVEAHIAHCALCCRALEAVPADGLVGLALAALGGSARAGSEPPGTPPPLVGHPRYRVLARLGAGGMGVVFKAEHMVMGRTVALKVLNPETTSGAGAAERFRREVRLASKLNHPNIVTAHDAEEAGGLHFLVMEYVDGTSLDRYVARKGPLPVALACQFVRQAALGLQHAFESGMVHRDVKPHNLMVTRKGQVKVLDFGLAQVAAPEVRHASRTSPGLTTPGVVVGTPDFLAPEQAKTSATLDHRADIYSLGCTLYFLLTGCPPFPAGSPVEKLIAHVQHAPTPVGTFRQDVPAGLAAVLDRMMAKKPDDRYQTPAEVVAALLPFARAGATGATPASRPTVADQAATPTEPTRAMATPLVTPPARATVVRPVATRDDAADEPARSAPRRKRKRRPDSFLARYPAAVAGAVAAVVVLPLLGWAAARMLTPGGDKDKSAAVAPAPTPPGPPAAQPEAKPKGETPDGPSATPPASADPGSRKPEVTPAPTPPAPADTGPKTVLLVLPTQDLYYREFETVRQHLTSRGVKTETVGLTTAAVRAALPPGPGGPGGPGMGGPGFPPKKKGPPPGGGAGFPPPGGPGLGGPGGPGGLPSETPTYTLAEAVGGPADRADGVVFFGGQTGLAGYFPGGTGGADMKRLLDRMRERNKVVAAIGPGEQVPHAHQFEGPVVFAPPDRADEVVARIVEGMRK